MNWLDEVGEYFPRDSGARFPPPVRHMFISEQHKLLYSPVAKCACTSLKRLMVDLSRVEHRDIIVKFGVHRVTANFNTGTRLKDHAPETVNRVLCSDDFYKFAVVRDPVSRTISAYTEKFLVNRNSPENLLHTIDTVRSVRGESSVDTRRGISFREFVSYLLESEPADLDPHWAPQYYSLGNVDSYNDVFCVEHLDKLADRLTQWTGQSVSIGKHNVSLQSEVTPPETSLGRYVDRLPSELDGVGKISPSDFMDHDLVERLQAYFSDDLALYRAAREGLSNYQPREVHWGRGGRPASTSTIRDVSIIARSVTLYSKGFFALDDSGSGVLQVLISNSKARPLALNANGPCYLVYRLCDSTGNVISSDQYQVLDIDKLDANGQRWETVFISVPPDLSSVVSSVTVLMQIGDSFRFEELSSLHFTCALRIRVS